MDAFGFRVQYCGADDAAMDTVVGYAGISSAESAFAWCARDNSESNRGDTDLLSSFPAFSTAPRSSTGIGLSPLAEIALRRAMSAEPASPVACATRNLSRLDR